MEDIGRQRSAIDTVYKALEKTERLLSQNPERVHSDEIHSVKSVLYAAIEQVRMRVERLSTLQRMLRELFVIASADIELKSYEREAGKQIIDEIMRSYGRTRLESSETLARTHS